MTRRTAIGTGLAFATLVGTAGLGALGSSVPRHLAARSIDALLIDNSIELPRQMAAFISTNTAEIPVTGIGLDAAALPGLMRVLAASQAIVGVSSGATLFCLERIARDQGFRLTGLTQQCSSGPGGDACRQDVMAFLSGMHGSEADPSQLVRGYRPSRADGTLHAWLMRKSSPQHRLNHREA